MQDYNQAFAYVATLTGIDPASAVIDWRAIHDVDKAVAAIPFRGTLVDCWPSIVHYNSQGYGIFACFNEMDGNGRELPNVRSIRAHVVDLDNLSARQNYDRAARSYPAPQMGVCSSPGKYHVYWCVEPYAGNERFTAIQRKLVHVFDSDKRIVDATRVLRVPGTLHLKNPAAPHLVTCEALPGISLRGSIEALEIALHGVNAIDTGGGRHALGDPDLAAPSLDWIRYALDVCDPNTLDRGEWIAITSAMKQAAWTLSDPDTIRNIWEQWCARYHKNDAGENEKQWNSIRDTQLGWKSLVGRIPALKAAVTLGPPRAAGQPAPAPAPGDGPVPTPAVPVPPPLDCSSPRLTDAECKEWFADCLYVTNLGLMLTGDGRFLNASQFNVVKGGKQFLWTDDGKMTDEPWKAATRSTLWQVPKVDHIRFLPHRPYGERIVDDRGRVGVNTYKPANIIATPGDPSPFLRHIALMLPEPADQKYLLDYLAHNVRFPGHKIPWAPVIQSVEGIGKGVIKSVMSHAMGRSYTYFPNASQLGEGGAKFNKWMRNKLFLIADEIKTDEKRELVEILKPFISEKELEIQGKGADQDLEDNYSNWLFFTNWKDAIPVDRNGRRYGIFFSPIQTVEDLMLRQMGDAYFNALYAWLDAGGAAIVTHYFLNYPIERGALPMRAPITSSMSEAVKLSRGPLERMVVEAVEDGLAGFRGGYISTLAVTRRAKETGVRAMSPQTIETALGKLGYHPLGRALRPYRQEEHLTRTNVFALDPAADIALFGRAQGYE